MLHRCKFGTYFFNWLTGIMAAIPTLLDIAKNTRVVVVAGSRVAAALQNFTRDDPYGKGVTFVRDQAEKDRVCLILQRFGVQTVSLSRTAAYTLAFLQWTGADFVVCDGGAVPRSARGGGSAGWSCSKTTAIAAPRAKPWTTYAGARPRQATPCAQRSNRQSTCRAFRRGCTARPISAP